jgi:dipeptidyl aminopeptidase/acylaminoacyl peptidase
MRIPVLAAAGLIAAVTALTADKKLELTIDAIMQGPALTGYEPQNARWSQDGARIYFDWKQAADPVLRPADTYVVSRDGSGLRKLGEEEWGLAPPPAGETSKDKRQTVFERDGDIYMYDRPAGQSRRLTRTSEAESDPHFTRDGRRVCFTRDGNLYVMALDGGSIEQLTDIRPHGAARRPTDEPEKVTDSQEFLKKQERRLLDAVDQRAKQREESEAKRKRDNPRKPYLLQQRQSVTSLRLSPDEKTVFAVIAESGERAKKSIVPNYVTESAYTEEISSRLLAGDVQEKARLELLDAVTGEVRHATSELKSELAWTQPVWSEDGSKAMLSVRAADNKDRWILALDTPSGKTRVLFADHDDAWINNFGASAAGWLKDNQTVYFQSERSGYAHLYAVSLDGGEPRALTSGNWEVERVHLSEDGSTFYMTSNEGDTAEVHLYALPSAGGPRTRITKLPGRHRLVFAPREAWIADVYSYTNRPPELYAMENVPGAMETKLTSSPSPEFRSYSWQDAPIVRFKARDGVEVPARLYKPSSYPRGRPAVIFVHGAGYMQNVHRGWSQYSREYLFHHFLMEHGYLVLDVDYRGSAGYGRDWRTAIYRHMGGKDLDDQVDAARYLVSEHGADPKRIGIYGGSYGGFITLMAMFTQGDVFAAGAALRPVTDWAHYNHRYTSSILNLPQQDAEAYRRSSPIYFAEGLKGALLLCHGMVDVNVHFQDTVRLAQRLIELRKENWELAVFPVEDHGFVQPSSWADEYKRIFRLFERNLK